MVKRSLIFSLCLLFSGALQAASQSTALSPFDLGARAIGVVAAGGAGIWAFNRTKDMLKDMSKAWSGVPDREVPTFADDVKNVLATGTCVAGVAVAGYGLSGKTLSYLAAIGFETGLMGTIYFGGRHVAGLEDMRLRHAVMLSLVNGIARGGANRLGVPHFRVNSADE